MERSEHEVDYSERLRDGGRRRSGLQLEQAYLAQADSGGIRHDADQQYERLRRSPERYPVFRGRGVSFRGEVDSEDYAEAHSGGGQRERVAHRRRLRVCFPYGIGRPPVGLSGIGSSPPTKTEKILSFCTRPVNFTWRLSERSAFVDAEVRAACSDGTDECRVELSGRITIDSSPDLQALLLRSVRSSICKTLTVDLYDVAYIDTSGLAVLLEVLRGARSQGKQLRLSGLRGKPRYLLEATQMLHFFLEVDREAHSAGKSDCGGMA